MLCLPGSLLGKGAGGPVLDMVFAGASSLDSRITFSRASSATDLLFTAAVGTYNSFSTGVPRLLASGLLLEETRTQRFGITDVPATQTITLANGTYQNWMIGTGSVTSAAGTALGSGFGAASQGVPNVITITTGGTVVFTVAGAPSRMQLELGGFPTSYIPNAGAAGTTVTRAAEIATIATSAFAWNNTASSFALEFMAVGGANGGTAARLIGGDGGAGTWAPLTYDNGVGSQLKFLDGTNNAPSGSSVALNALRKGVSAFSASGSVAGMSGALGTPNSTITFANITGTTKLDLGANDVGGLPAGCVYISRFRYYNRRLSDAQLVALAT